MAATLRFDLGSDTLHPAFASLAKHLADVQQQGDVALNLANALWLQQGFDVQQAFLDTLEQFYAANFFQVNFAEAYEAVREEINKWIEEQTRDKITNLLPPGTLNALTRLVLTNAIYFKGNWAQTFSPDATAEAPFWISPKKSVPVEMMYQQTVLKYGDIDEGQVVILPYAGEALSMVVLLPKERDGLNAMETKLTAERVTTWIAQAAAREVKVYLPKFRFTSQFNLSATLQTMGMQEAFSENADFSGMASDKQLSISDVVHKAFVEINEEGTEAAAATAVIVGVTSVGEPPPIPVFQADHPFIFLIQDKLSGSFLFVGRVVNPGS
jgi:serpin B